MAKVVCRTPIDVTQPLTTGQVARLCKVAPRTVVKWCDDPNGLKNYKIYGSLDRRICAGDLVEFCVRTLMPVPDEVKPVAVVTYGLQGVDPVHGLHVRHACSGFEWGALLASTSGVRLALVGDAFGASDAAGAARLARELHPAAQVVVVRSEGAERVEVQGVTHLDRPVDWARLGVSAGG